MKYTTKKVIKKATANGAILPNQIGESKTAQVITPGVISNKRWKNRSCSSTNFFILVFATYSTLGGETGDWRGLFFLENVFLFFSPSPGGRGLKQKLNLKNYKQK